MGCYTVSFGSFLFRTIFVNQKPDGKYLQDPSACVGILDIRLQIVETCSSSSFSSCRTCGKYGRAQTCQNRGVQKGKTDTGGSNTTLLIGNLFLPFSAHHQRGKSRFSFNNLLLFRSFLLMDCFQLAKAHRNGCFFFFRSFSSSRWACSATLKA